MREAKRQAQERAEEERSMQQLVDDELKRRDLLRQKRQTTHVTPLSPDEIAFDQPIQASRVASEASGTFQTVRIIKSLGQGPLAKTLEVQVNRSDDVVSWRQRP